MIEIRGESIPVIDFHCHVNWRGWTIRDVYDHFQNMGVDRAVALSWDEIIRRHTGDYVLPVEDPLYAHGMFPDFFIPFTAPDPKLPGALGQVRALLSSGRIKGIGEFKFRYPLDDPDSVEMMAVGNEFGAAFTFHVDIMFKPGGMWYNIDAHKLPALCKRFPDLKFLGHAPGFWRHVSGDADDPAVIAEQGAYPRTSPAPGGKLHEWFESLPNLYGDLSAGSAFVALTRHEDGGKGFLERHQDKLLYATDDFTTKLMDHLLSLELDQEVYRKVFYRNASQVLGMDEAELRL